ncbi:MAG: tryptophan-rich sensory protein [Clostridia bacterium]|nr:tryptophan-rich sensory protein [Clostridia bacterium]
MKNLFTYVKSILIPLLIGGFVGFITSSYMNNSMLVQPKFAPPAILFPIVWTILYTLMGVSYGILKTNSLTDDKTNKIYYAQLFVNALWSFFFFVFEWRLFSFFWILLLIALVILMIIEFYKKNKVAGLLQIPYLLWIIFASFLNLSIYLLNK